MMCPCGSFKTERNGKCGTCNRNERKAAAVKIPDDPKPIKKQSDEMKRMMALYVRKKAAFLRKNRKCAVMPHLASVDVHHRAGRGIHSYYDEAAREAGMPLLLDERFWLPVSREGHDEIERRPEWAKRMGFSEYRLIPMRMRGDDY